VSIFGAEQLNTRVLLSHNEFIDGWGIGLIFFGMHLALLGYLALKCGFIPKIFGILLLIAGAGYVVEYCAKFLVPGFSFDLGLITGWGELIFMFWLLIRGGKNPTSPGPQEKG
jgi:hypothetical protein